MNTFKLVQFRGIFRDYQQTVLDNMQQHLQNKKIHIVAAPGSGKTVLGLELIRRLNGPALILSPSVTIRGQWGMRFKEKFLPETQTLEDYFSFNLKNPNLITSVTYQALHAAMIQVNEVENTQHDADDSFEPKSKAEDFSGFDLIETIRKTGVKTICLDEAHHLRSEWQKALEQFIHTLQSEVTVIALTATPPYESIPSEWNKYISLCGEIDDEIFVPELVAKGTLCPHQDYIYFNYPTKAELNIIREYKEKAASCTTEIINGELFNEIINKSGLLTDYAQQKELILENAKGFIAFFALCMPKGKKYHAN